MPAGKLHAAHGQKPPPVVPDEKEAWEAYRDGRKRAGLRSTPAYLRTSFQAGFNAGLMVAGKVKSFLRVHETLQRRSLKLQAENIAMRHEIRILKSKLTSIKRITTEKR